MTSLDDRLGMKKESIFGRAGQVDPGLASAQPQLFFSAKLWQSRVGWLLDEDKIRVPHYWP